MTTAEDTQSEVSETQDLIKYVRSWYPQAEAFAHDNGASNLAGVRCFRDVRDLCIVDAHWPDFRSAWTAAADELGRYGLLPQVNRVTDATYRVMRETLRLRYPTAHTTWSAETRLWQLVNCGTLACGSGNSVDMAWFTAYQALRQQVQAQVDKARAVVFLKYPHAKLVYLPDEEQYCVVGSGEFGAGPLHAPCMLAETAWQAAAAVVTAGAAPVLNVVTPETDQLASDWVANQALWYVNETQAIGLAAMHTAAINIIRTEWPATADWLCELCQQQPLLVKWTWLHWLQKPAPVESARAALLQYRTTLRRLLALRCGENANLNTLAKQTRVPSPTESAAWALRELGVDMPDATWSFCISWLVQDTY